MRNIHLTIQTGLAERDLLRCGVVEALLAHPEVRVVLLTPAHRDPIFRAEFEGSRVVVEPFHMYLPTTMKWRLMTRRWRHVRNRELLRWWLRLEEALIPAHAYDEAFHRYPPALVVSGEPLRPGDNTLVRAAHRHGVPSLGSVRSWDNLLKHLRTRPDRLTVWNPINHAEAVELERYRPGEVAIVGAPQLDPYFQPAPALSRAGLFAQLGLDPTKRLLLLATSSFTYESDQTYLVDLLVEAIEQRRFREPVQLLVRLHPSDNIGPYLKYRHSPHVCLDLPDRWSRRLGWTMEVADIQRMAALLRHTDVMLNFATTVTLEAAICDTPTLLVAFSTVDPEEMERYVVGLHFKMHYKGLVERDLVPIAWNQEELVDWINCYLADPAVYREQRRQVVRDWVHFTDGQSAQRLAAAILRAAGLEAPVDAGTRRRGDAETRGRGEGSTEDPPRVSEVPVSELS
ncbi:MAG: CDP-glycerol glycerophosphotransferase family protein [Chloroflexi bacterium]|nr:CDP-glycerol glycerophosphotransferase family protein [Chloroflexota bacterium]